LPWYSKLTLDVKTTNQRRNKIILTIESDYDLDLLFSDMNTDLLLEKLAALFLTNPILAQPHRNPPRKKSSASGLLSFHTRQKNIAFKWRF